MKKSSTVKRRKGGKLALQRIRCFQIGEICKTSLKNQGLFGFSKRSGCRYRRRHQIGTDLMLLFLLAKGEMKKCYSII